MVYGSNKVAGGRTYWVENGKVNNRVIRKVNGRDYFANVLIRRPENRYNTAYIFRPYAVMDNNGENIVIYGPEMSRSMYTVCKQILLGRFQARNVRISVPQKYCRYCGKAVSHGQKELYQMKSKRNTVWIVLTCMLAVLVFVLSAALYGSWKITEALQTQLAEMQNGVFAVEVVQGQQETATAGDVQTVRVMNGILQQQDTDGQWVDVAPVEELAQADPILAGRNKMQELIAQNKEAVQNGTISAEQISPLLAKQSSIEEMALEFASQVQSAAEKRQHRRRKRPRKRQPRLPRQRLRLPLRQLRCLHNSRR